jgi:hypothetical protein
MAAQPRYLDMTPEELRAAYWAARDTVAGWAEMAPYVQSAPGRRQVSRGVFRNLDRLDLIVAVARKRGVDLLS